MTTLGDLRFRFDWEPIVEAVRAPELRSTWARLEAWLGDTCITLAEDVSTGSVRRSISVPLYPLAEWIAFNWWSIAADGRDGARSAQRRNVRSAGDGFLWPDLEIIPAGKVSLVRWNRLRALRGDPLRYMSYGERWVDAADLHETLADVVAVVVNRLREDGIGETPLEKEWAALRALDPDEVAFCQAAARLGLDPLSEGIDVANSIDAVFEDLEPPLRDEFLDAADPEAIHPALTWVREALAHADEAVGDDSGAFSLSLVSSAVRELSATDIGAQPWAVGYETARLLRDHLGLRATDPIQDLPVYVLTREAPVYGFTGAGKSFSSNHTSLVIPRRMNPASEKFAGGRALWHAAETLSSGSYLITSSRTATQQVGRAFAAELLAPAAGIRELLGDQTVAAAPEDVALLADHFGSSEMVIAHQVENQLTGGREVS